MLVFPISNIDVHFETNTIPITGVVISFNTTVNSYRELYDILQKSRDFINPSKFDMLYITGRHGHNQTECRITLYNIITNLESFEKSNDKKIDENDENDKNDKNDDQDIIITPNKKSIKKEKFDFTLNNNNNINNINKQQNNKAEIPVKNINSNVDIPVRIIKNNTTEIPVNIIKNNTSEIPVNIIRNNNVNRCNKNDIKNDNKNDNNKFDYDKIIQKLKNNNNTFPYFRNNYNTDIFNNNAINESNALNSIYNYYTNLLNI